MDSNRNLKVELQGIDDIVDTIELKIHNLVGLLEIMCLGIRALNHIDDSYELSCVRSIQDCLKAIEKTDVPILHEKVVSLKEQV